MPWIQSIAAHQATGSLRAAYAALRGTFPPEYGSPPPETLRNADGTSDSVLAVHGLLPEVLKPMFEAMAKLMSPELPLSRQQHEMIGTLVSVLNGCHY